MRPKAETEEKQSGKAGEQLGTKPNTAEQPATPGFAALILFGASRKKNWAGVQRPPIQAKIR